MIEVKDIEGLPFYKFPNHLPTFDTLMESMEKGDAGTKTFRVKPKLAGMNGAIVIDAYLKGIYAQKEDGLLAKTGDPKNLADFVRTIDFEPAIVGLDTLKLSAVVFYGCWLAIKTGEMKFCVYAVYDVRNKEVMSDPVRIERTLNAFFPGPERNSMTIVDELRHVDINPAGSPKHLAAASERLSEVALDYQEHNDWLKVKYDTDVAGSGLVVTPLETDEVSYCRYIFKV